MTDNAIILGAGASVDAGIPLLANFVEKMWEFAITGKQGEKELSAEDKQIFSESIKVRNELDGYHGRASFDDRNIEDILSILSFNMIGGDETDLAKLQWINKAIARTIELTCSIKHDGVLNRKQGDTNVYQWFWASLFKRFSSSPKSFPTIISFNYDLVMERSLFQTLINTKFSNGDYDSTFPFDGITLKYQYKFIEDVSYLVKYIQYQNSSSDSYLESGVELGTKLVKCNAEELKNPVEVEILKLHGSLNFSSSKKITSPEFNPTNPVDDPYIIPPNINKSISTDQTMWGIGLKKLREAKNIVIVGYSMPQTDIYMQYFIKAGIGPNVNLNKIVVFNPTLFTSGKENDEMRERFGNCFSPQLRNRIDFEPFGIEDDQGTFKSFVDFGPIRSNNVFFG